jgi:hypothetical protein
LGFLIEKLSAQDSKMNNTGIVKAMGDEGDRLVDVKGPMSS